MLLKIKSEVKGILPSVVPHCRAGVVLSMKLSNGLMQGRGGKEGQLLLSIVPLSRLI